MATLRPDPTFYPSAKQAAEAPPEELAYLAMLSPNGSRSDAIGVVDVKPGSKSYGRVVGQFDMPNRGDELHHFGWNACSASLCPWAPHPHVERRYLIVPGINSSRIHILDTKSNPRKPELVKVIEPETLAKKTNYASPHTVHCGPDGIYISALGAPNGDGPGGIFVLDHDSFEPKGIWEKDRGPQRLGYDFAWHLGHDTTITSEWGTPNMVNSGVVPELLLGGKYGNSLHVWNLRNGRHQQKLHLGDEYQMTLELRPARDPRKAYGFVGVVISLADLSASVWMWYNVAKGEGGSSRLLPLFLPPLLEPGRSRRSSRFPPSRPIRPTCRRCCRDSRRCRRSSPTSTCRSTTGSSTCRAGAPASSGSTTPPTPSIPASPRQRRSGGSSAARPTRRSPASGSTVVPRWWS